MVGDWSTVRAQFQLDPSFSFFGAWGATPKQVRDAVAVHREAYESDPYTYHISSPGQVALQSAMLDAVVSYLGAAGAHEVALCENTTVGCGILYNAISIRADQEIIVPKPDYKLGPDLANCVSARTSCGVTEVSLYDTPFYTKLTDITADDVVDRIIGAVTPATRLIFLTWIDPSTGLRMPVERIAEELAVLNDGRAPEDRALLCLDAINGIGVEDFGAISDLGADFVVSGLHKYFFGPRGTGFVWGREDAWQDAGIVRGQASDNLLNFLLAGVIPFEQAFQPDPVVPANWGYALTTGGMKGFENYYALPDAVAFHEAIGGRALIHQHSLDLTDQLLNGLLGMAHVEVHSPVDEAVRSHVVSFALPALKGYLAKSFTDYGGPVRYNLYPMGIQTSVTPPGNDISMPFLARASPCLLNTSQEVDDLLAAIDSLK